MKRYLFASIVLSLTCSSAFAVPSLCLQDTLTNYLADGFSCAIGDKTFGNFFSALTAATVLGTATPTSFGAIQVIPSGGSANPGFSFAASFAAKEGGLSDINLSTVTFTVGYTGFAPANDPFTAVSIFLTQAAVTGLGAINAAEAVCENGSFTSPLNPLLCTGIGVNSALTSNITNANLNATVVLSTPPIVEIGLIKQIVLTDNVFGNATASALNNSFVATLGATPIPEPCTFLLSGVALVFVSKFLKRRFQ